MIARGDIRWFRFASPDKRRPVLVLGRTDVLPSLSQVPVIPLSTQMRGLAWEVPLGTEEGLPSPCVLKPEWIRIVERSYLGPLIATLPEAKLPLIRAAASLELGKALEHQAVQLGKHRGAVTVRAERFDAVDVCLSALWIS